MGHGPMHIFIRREAPTVKGRQEMGRVGGDGKGSERERTKEED